MNSSHTDIMLDMDSTVFKLLVAMSLLPGGERITYEATKTWDGLIDLCGPEHDPDDPSTHLTHDERLHIMLDLFDKAMHFDHMTGMGSDAIFEGCVEQLQRLDAEGVRIHVVTDRPNARIECTRRFLAAAGVPFEDVHRISGRDKTQWCIDRGITVMVDDHPDTITAAAAAGLTAMGLAYHFNREHAERAGVTMYESWAEMGPAISRALKQSGRASA